jgi:hypothetical protein
VLERALAEEMTGHLGYEKHDPAGRGSGNSRNGSTGKTLLTTVGAVDLAVPRDRNGSSDPKIVRTGQTRLASAPPPGGGSREDGLPLAAQISSPAAAAVVRSGRSLPPVGMAARVDQYPDAGDDEQMDQGGGCQLVFPKLKQNHEERPVNGPDRRVSCHGCLSLEPGAASARHADSVRADWVSRSASSTAFMS